MTDKSIDEQVRIAVEKALKEQEKKFKKEVEEKAKAKEAVKKGIHVLFGGTYYHKENANTSAKQYEVMLHLIDDPDYRLPREDKLMQIGRLKLLPHYFTNEGRSDYPFYNGIREVKILDIKIIGGEVKRDDLVPGEKPIGRMTMKQLIKFV